MRNKCGQWQELCGLFRATTWFRFRQYRVHPFVDNEEDEDGKDKYNEKRESQQRTIHDNWKKERRINHQTDWQTNSFRGQPESSSLLSVIPSRRFIVLVDPSLHQASAVVRRWWGRPVLNLFVCIEASWERPPRRSRSRTNEFTNWPKLNFHSHFEFLRRTKWNAKNPQLKMFFRFDKRNSCRKGARDEQEQEFNIR